jgi:hypothetical protein
MGEIINYLVHECNVPLWYICFTFAIHIVCLMQYIISLIDRYITTKKDVLKWLAIIIVAPPFWGIATILLIIAGVFLSIVSMTEWWIKLPDDKNQKP